MKKTFKTFALMLLTALAFSSCVDVPAPYNLPIKKGGSSAETTVVPTGDGTLASPFNVAAVVALISEMEAGVESTEEYYIKGKVSNVKTDAATISQYGNHTFEMIDEGNSSVVFTAYQVYGPGKQKFTSVDDIKVGDEVVVCGKVVNYKGNTPETVGRGAAYVVSINASGEGGGGSEEEGTAITCAEAVNLTNDLAANETSTETYSVTGYITNVPGEVSTKTGTPQQTFWMADTKDGGKIFQAYFANVPNGVSAFSVGMKVKITGKLTKYEKNGNITPEMANPTVVILTDGDEGGSGNIDGQEGNGTAESPYNVAAIVAKINTMSAGEESTEEYYIKGKVSNVKTTAQTIEQYGNHTFEMIDEGNSSVVFTAFQVYGPGKQKFTSVDDIKVGDVVVVCGKVVNYKGNTPETVGKGAAYVVSINGSGDDGGGGGGQTGDVQHITIAEFLAKADPNTTYELTGEVKNISNTTYGNFDLVEGDASIYVYGLLDLSGAAQKFAGLGIAEGDIVTLTGKYFLYNDKPEIKNAQFVKVEKGQGGGGGDGGDTPPGPGGDPVTDLVNGDFESWVSDSEPTGWKSASPASNATLGKSTEARNGSFACKVVAPGTANKRLATQEITLEAGTYTFSYYAKSTTTSVCQTKGGYVHVNDDGTITDSYQYSKDYANINNSDWTLVSYEFTLSSTTKLCLLVMNPKNSSYSVSQDILVDDATLTKQ